MPATVYLSIRNADGSVQRHETPPGTYYFGRDPQCNFVLRNDSVSRRHVCMVLQETAFEIEDLGSTSGTLVQGQPLQRKLRLRYPQVVEIGGVAVQVSLDPPDPASMPSGPLTSSGREAVKITMVSDATERGVLPIHGVAEQMAGRLKMLYDLPLQFAAEPDLANLYKLILTRVMELIPGAKRGVLLIIERPSGKLSVRASVPEDHPPISRTLIKRAALEQQGFIWGDEQDPAMQSQSIVTLQIRTGMYVPLVWQGQTLGVLCVDNPKNRAVFKPEDLQFMISVAQYAASSVANQLLQDDIAQNNRTLQHLLANFSPKLRDKLLQKSREGRLQPGGEKSNVTILMSDLRGFTRISATLDAQVVVDMLNDYFSVLGDLIFQHDGTIDKFIGDAILAIFNSPEPDDKHELRAVECAIVMQRTTQEINARRRAEGLPCCELGIGVHTGEVLHGFIGAQERMEFTVIGDTVNKAARYCDGATAGQIVLGPLTHEAVRGTIQAESRTIDTKHEGGMQAWLVTP